MTVAEVVGEVLRDRIFYDDSGGGVTFSGGEPLQQFPFLMALLRASREQGVHTAVDTCGFAPREELLAVAPLTDLFLYDLKIMDPARHEELTGISNAPVLENLEALGRIHGEIWIRVPVIPGINDDDGNLEATARFAATIEGVRRVHLLPYNRAGIQKFRRLGKTYQLAEIVPPSPERMEELAGRFRSYGFETGTGG
jgi:pyruvate formate lyase activating enzyme